MALSEQEYPSEVPNQRPEMYHKKVVFVFGIFVFLYFYLEYWNLGYCMLWRSCILYMLQYAQCMHFIQQTH